MSDLFIRLARPVLGGLGGLWIGFGLWAFVAPHSFYDVVATFEPYNRHFLHDVGAMQFGIGAGALAGALTLRPVVSGLVGLAAYQCLHVLSHVIDRHLGGTPWFDIPGLTLLAAIGVVALLGAMQRDRPV